MFNHDQLYNMPTPKSHLCRTTRRSATEHKSKGRIEQERPTNKGPTNSPIPRQTRQVSQLHNLGPRTPNQPARESAPPIHLPVRTPVVSSRPVTTSTWSVGSASHRRWGGRGAKEERTSPTSSGYAASHASNTTSSNHTDSAVSPSLRAQVVSMHRALEAAIADLEPPNHLGELLKNLGVNVAIASQLQLTNLENIKAYSQNELKDLTTMFSKAGLMENDYIDTLIRLRTFGKTIDKFLYHNFAGISAEVINGAQRSTQGPAIDTFLSHLQSNRVFDLFRELFITHYWTERKIILSYLDDHAQVRALPNCTPSALYTPTPNSTTTSGDRGGINTHKCSSIIQNEHKCSPETTTGTTKIIPARSISNNDSVKTQAKSHSPRTQDRVKHTTPSHVSARSISQSFSSLLKGIMRSKGIDDVLVQSIGIETMSDVIGHSKKDISELFNMFSLRELREKRIWDTLIRLTALGIALRSSLSNGLLATIFDIMYRPNVKLDLNAIISDAVADTSLNKDFISNYWRVRKQYLDILEQFPSKTDVNVLSVNLSRCVRDSRSQYHDRLSHSVLSHVPCMSTTSAVRSSRHKPRAISNLSNYSPCRVLKEEIRMKDNDDPTMLPTTASDAVLHSHSRHAHATEIQDTPSVTIDINEIKDLGEMQSHAYLLINDPECLALGEPTGLNITDFQELRSLDIRRPDNDFVASDIDTMPPPCGRFKYTGYKFLDPDPTLFWSTRYFDCTHAVYDTPNIIYRRRIPRIL